MEILDDYFKEKIKDKVVLDLGFAGFNLEINQRTKILIQHSKKWYGGDKDKKFISCNKKEYKYIFYCDLDDPSFTKDFPKDEEIITLIEVLEHLQNPHQTIKALCQYKGKNTNLLVTVPNGMSLGRIFFGLIRKKYLSQQDINHYYLFNKQTLVNLLRSAGLREFTIKPYVNNKLLKIFLDPFPNFASGFLVYGK